MINAYTIAQYEAATASKAIKAIKDKASSGADLRKNYWLDYVKAKEDARLALTKIAIIKTYAECVGEAFGEAIYCDLPSKNDFQNTILGKKWTRRHADKNVMARAYRSIIRTQNRIKQKPGSYKSPWVAHHESAAKWAEGRKNVH